ncbi:unnamed protein product [Rhizophagus irregularis]|uniref:Thioredoxin n=1 Tax=Rhizophagus irregularis TaxID=588596 RepID=A0A2N1MPG6_9GLOM|nr:putative secreted salivary gland peptide [Rhizophagus irregularis]CAB4390319.1 unnamed protein product [Rhizophagus irregularis]CAB5327043.1 unnamed protein product [Rhizophagus irregularis]
MSDNNNYFEIRKKEEFEQHLNKGKLVVVDFSASWCGPCKTMAPVFKNFADKEFPDVIFLKVDGDENPELTAEYNITAYPTFLLFKNGKKIEGADVIGADQNSLKTAIKDNK